MARTGPTRRRAIPRWGELKKYLEGNWKPQRQGASDDLTKVPGVIMGHIFEYLLDERDDALITLLALEKTCRAFYDLFADDDVWKALFPRMLTMLTLGGRVNDNATPREKVFHWRGLDFVRRFHKIDERGTENIVLKYLGGAEGVQRIALHLLRFRPGPENDTFELRGDAIACLTEVIQGHMVEKLEKTNLMVCEHHDPGGGYPEIRPKDLRLVDLLSSNWDHPRTDVKMLRKDVDKWKLFPPRTDEFLHHCEGDEVLGKDARFKMARALAYRSGVVKMSEEAFYLVASEVLHRMFGLIMDASISAGYYDIGSIHYSAQDEVHNTRFPMIISCHMNDAAVRCGMKPVLGCGPNDNRWAPTSSVSRGILSTMALYGYELGSSIEDICDSGDEMNDAYEVDDDYETEDTSEDDDDDLGSSWASCCEMEDASEVDEEEMEDSQVDGEEDNSESSSATGSGIGCI